MLRAAVLMAVSCILPAIAADDYQGATWEKVKSLRVSSSFADVPYWRPPVPRVQYGARTPATQVPEGRIRTASTRSLKSRHTAKPGPWHSASS
jgi:hypothetical protein